MWINQILTQSEKTCPTHSSATKSQRIREHLSCLDADSTVSQKVNRSGWQQRRLYLILFQKWLSWHHWWQSSLEQRASEQPADWSRAALSHSVLASPCSPFQSLRSVSIPVIFVVCGNFETRFVKLQPAVLLLLHLSAHGNTTQKTEVQRFSWIS